jgi:hypothetical protein
MSFTQTVRPDTPHGSSATGVPLPAVVAVPTHRPLSTP